MRLAQRLILGAFAVVTALVLFIVVIAHNRLEERLLRDTTAQLVRKARLVGLGWTTFDRADSVADAAGVALRYRVTLIDSTGRVVGDSDFDGAALERLDNHLTRPEIEAARAAGFGSAQRVSASLGSQEIYAAVQDPKGFVRVAMHARDLEEITDHMRQDVLAAGLIATVLAMLLAWLFARSVARPISELSAVAGALAGGDLTRRPALAAPGEVGVLATALYQMADQLSGRLRALQTEETLMGAVIESLHEGILAVDAKRRVVRINESGRRLLGVRQNTPFPVDHLPRDRRLREALDEALAGFPSGPEDLRIDTRVLALSARPLLSGGAVLAVFDLTQQRRLETVRRDFVANVSHELKTPLTVIRGFADTLAEEEELPAETRRQFAETVRANAQRMHRIVDDLLDLSRIESGGWVPNPVLLDVGSAATDATIAIRDVAREKGVSISVAPDESARVVFADSTAFRQILANLVENAVRYTPPGGSVVVSSRGDPGGVTIEVRDTGIGIAAEHLPRIFERFYRVDPGRARGAGGTGLGLAIVRHLTEAHGGRVKGESTPGRGTKISIFLPFPAGAATASGVTPS